MAAARKVVELPIGETELAELRSIARSRTEPASHVARARMLLHYRDDPSCHAVGRAVGVTHQTVQRCLARTIRFGVMAALDDSPRPGKAPEITVPARAWLLSLACRKAKDVGYPHELWTTRLLARHSREHGPAAGHASLARIAQGTVCKLLAEQEVKPHKVRYYLERRDPEFEAKMAEVLGVYQEVAILRAAEASATKVAGEADTAAMEKATPNVAFVSYDEKPGIQAIANTAPDLPPVAGKHACVARDHEYKRLGTWSLLAGIDLLTGQVHACVENRHRSREFVGFLQKLDTAYPRIPRSRSFWTIIRRTCRRKPTSGLPHSARAALASCSHQSMAPGSTRSRASPALRPTPWSQGSNSPRTRSRPGSRKLPAQRLIRRLVRGWLRAPWRCVFLHGTLQFFIGLGGGDFANGLKEPLELRLSSRGRGLGLTRSLLAISLRLLSRRVKHQTSLSDAAHDSQLSRLQWI